MVKGVLKPLACLGRDGVSSGLGSLGQLDYKDVFTSALEMGKRGGGDSFN